MDIVDDQYQVEHDIFNLDLMSCLHQSSLMRYLALCDLYYLQCNGELVGM